MAARENQGLQIAIIIFVILTITLSVTTFMFFRKYEEANIEKNQHDADKRKAVERDTLSQEEIASLRKLLGTGKTETVASIQELFKEDMKAYAAAFKEPDQNYRHLVKHMHAELAASDARFVAAKEREEQLKAKIAAEEKAKMSEVAQYKTQLETSANDLKTERDNFNSTRDEVEKSKEEIAKQIEVRRKEAELAAKKATDEIAGLSNAVKRLQTLNTGFKEKESLKERVSDLPRGVVTWVNQRDRVAWINVGTDDNLRRQVTFKVLDPSEPNVVDAKGKAKLEVVKLLDKHSAECRIVEDNVSSPIMPGDKIYSQAWAPSRSQHFALVGLMDLDGDHESDRLRIKNLIAANNGVIDAEVADDGKRTGEISINTNFLIRGERPNDKHATPEFLKAYSEILAEADGLGVRQIPLLEFLNNIGYEPAAEAVVMDSSADSGDFKAKPPGGVVRRSPESFRPRRPTPPAKSRPSAY